MCHLTVNPYTQQQGGFLHKVLDRKGDFKNKKTISTYLNHVQRMPPKVGGPLFHRPSRSLSFQNPAEKLQHSYSTREVPRDTVSPNHSSHFKSTASTIVLHRIKHPLTYLCQYFVSHTTVIRKLKHGAGNGKWMNMTQVLTTFGRSERGNLMHSSILWGKKTKPVPFVFLFNPFVGAANMLLLEDAASTLPRKSCTLQVHFCHIHHHTHKLTT